MKYATLAEANAAYPREKIATDGYTTNLWHRQHQHYLEHVVPLLPRCDICGGKVDPRAKRHELCRLRREKGQPTPQMNDIRSCDCARCRDA